MSSNLYSNFLSLRNIGIGFVRQVTYTHNRSFIFAIDKRYLRREELFKGIYGLLILLALLILLILFVHRILVSD